jgi:hypothetical protein
LKTGASEPAEIGLSFIGSGSVDDKSVPAERFAFARYWLYTYTAADLAVRVDSWLPYRARAEVAQPAWLETPRMWIRGYRATVNSADVEVRRSPHNLVMIPLEPGHSTVALEFAAPLWLRLAFWICFGSWVALLAGGVRRVVVQARTFAA